MAITNSAYSTNISDNNKGCTNSTLTTYSGSAALEADWQPNPVTVTYYNGDNVYGNGGQCTYDSTLTLPSHPSRTGYTFAGWTVKSASCSGVACFDLSVNGTATFYHSYKKNNEYCHSFGSSGNYSNCSDTVFSDLERYEWKTDFEYGTIKGTSTCASNYANQRYSEGTPSGDGKYCWCKITEIDGIEKSLPWVALTTYAELSVCQEYCAQSCAVSMHNTALARAAMYGATIQRNVDCMTISDKNTCLSSLYNDVSSCRWINSACYGSTVNNCSIVNNQEACDTLEQTDGTLCRWINSSCHAVNSCESLTDKNICNTSWTADASCGWWNSSCHTFTTCDSILDEDFCNKPGTTDQDGIECVWSGSSCQAAEWCSDITDEDKCQGASSLTDTCQWWWRGYCGGPDDD